MAFEKGKKKADGTGPGSKAFDRFKERRASAGFPWSRVDGRLVLAALDVAAAHGVAIMCGGVQGGRGVVVTVFSDGDRHKEYASTVGELQEWLVVIVETLQGESDDYLAAYGLDREELVNAI